MGIDEALRLVSVGILIYEGLEQNGEGAIGFKEGKLSVDADLSDESLELALKLCSAKRTEADLR
jgi:hypothetical protein